MNHQRGVSFIITFFIMTIVIVATASVGTILYKEVKLVNDTANAVVATSAANTGLESAKYYANPAQGGICNTCNLCTTFGDANTRCDSCAAVGPACATSNCADCTIQYDYDFLGQESAVSFEVVPNQPQIATATGGYRDVTQVETNIDSGLEWSETGPAIGQDQPWSAVASDASGNHLIASVFTGKVYVSANGGDSWNVPAGISNANWMTVASSTDGKYMLAGATGNYVYLSSDFGVTFAPLTLSPPSGLGVGSWVSSAVCGSNNKFVIGAFAGRLYTYNGSIWKEAKPQGSTNRNWKGVACSDDGLKMEAADFDGALHFSSDSGNSWVKINPTGNDTEKLMSVTSSSDGARLATVIYGARAWVSVNSGANWTAQSFPLPLGSGPANWSTIASDAAGTNLITAASPGRLYISNGFSFAQAKPAGDVDQYWSGVDSNASGLQFLVSAYGGRLYISK